MTDQEKWLDSYLSWCVCIEELRKRHVIAGKDQPRNEEERQWLTSHNSKR